MHDRIIVFEGASQFFLQEYILISQRYQLHTGSATTHCPSSNMDANNQKKKNNDNKKIPLQRSMPRSSSTKTTLTTLEVQFLQK
jgi:hypothetical protein